MTWVILVITYGGFLDGTVSYVPMPSQDACERMMDVTLAELSDSMPDMMLQCLPTEKPRVRPIPRPESMEGTSDGP